MLFSTKAITHVENAKENFHEEHKRRPHRDPLRPGRGVAATPAHPAAELRYRTAGQVWPDAAGLSQESASCAVQPDVAERYALAAFAGCPESGLCVSGTHDDHSVRQVPRAGQRARTASLGGAHERAESAGGGGSGEGSRVCRMIPDSI